MATEVIHTKKLEDGSFRIILDEPHGINQAHRIVKVNVSGMKYDHSGVRLRTKGTRTFEEPYDAGDDVGYLEYYLSGQREFMVPSESTSIEFDDGVVHNLVEAPAPAAPVTSEVSQ